ncbi:hypothetical protein C8Q80DRAFT_1121986 [Daedaleopsis nitida]|nr:hypothetical protein C8Q80DRAFT_1121986 [Daedaleopsis nitida]
MPGLDAASPVSFHHALSQSDDAIEAYRQMLTRLHIEADEFGRREEETRRAIAHQQDQAARWHARADTTLESMKNMLVTAEHRVANAEQRAAQFAHLEIELALRENELSETRASLDRLEAKNVELRRQFEEERNHADERRRLDEKRINDAITKAAEALRTADNAMKQLESRKREHEIAESLMRKKAEEERTRSTELVAQLERFKRQAELDKAALQAELDQYKRLADQEKQRRMEELVEEKRRLEKRLAQATSGQDSQTGRDVPRPSKLQHTSAPPSPVDPSAYVHEEVAAQADGPSATPNAGSVTAAMFDASQALPEHIQSHTLSSHEPLLAVKEEDTKNVVKNEQRSPILPPDHPQANYEEQRINSLEPQLARENYQTKHDLDVEPPIASTSTTLSSVLLLHPSSPAISLGTRSPEPVPVYGAQPDNFPSNATGPPGYNPRDVSSPGQSSALHSQAIARPPPPPVLRTLVIPQEYGRTSHPADSPPPHKRARLIRNRGNEPSAQGDTQRNDHYSPVRQNRQRDHWSPHYEQNYGHDSPPRRKRTREDDVMLGRPDVHRHGPNSVVNDPHREAPPLARRFTGMPLQSQYDAPRQRTPEHSFSYPESPIPHRHVRAYDRRYDDSRNSYAPPARDGARTPPYPADDPNIGWHRARDSSRAEPMRLPPSDRSPPPAPARTPPGRPQRLPLENRLTNSYRPAPRGQKRSR